MKQVLIILFVGLFLGYANIYKFKILRVYDGDTFFIDIKDYPAIIGKNIGIRINGIDTPEIKRGSKESKAKGIIAKKYLMMIFEKAKKIELTNIKRGKYFRIVADVYVDNKNVTEMMIKAGMGKEYYGGKK